MSVRMIRRLGPMVAAALALLTTGATLAAAGNRLTSTQIQDYNAAAMDSSRAGRVVHELRSFLANDPDSTHAVMARRLMIRAMFTLNAPGPQIIALIDSTGRMLPHEPQVVVFFYAQLAEDVMDRGLNSKKAIEYAHRALDAMPKDEQYAQLRGLVIGILGRAQLAYPQPDSAIATLRRAVAHEGLLQPGQHAMGAQMLDRHH